ncbi:MAG: sigma-54-dependent Fis family transcriptional regulator [SAR116 cluster bacterium]|nr:sigma-54-dependent Fis family transcriptional regulator [SAR116 cluster bacterium]
MKDSILIVDDEPDIRDTISAVLNDEGYETICASNAQEAQITMNNELPSLIILDIWMRDSTMDGLSLLNWIKDSNPEIPIVMISGHGTVEIAVNAIKAGAYDFIEKPFKSEKLIFMVSRALENSVLKKENAELKEQIRRPDMIVGKSSLINSIRQTIGKVSQTNSRVLILGSSGSGKEACARTIHQESPRRNASFVHVNCSTISEEELFGQESKIKNKKSMGLFEKANRGTLYFDEICDLSLELQSKIIYAVQQQRFKRIGSNHEISVDVRVVSSSSKNIKQQIEIGNLREDLYYRLGVVPIEMPDLNSHPQDIPDLVNYYMSSAAAVLNKPVRVFSDDAIASLQKYNWPGNLNELRNIIDWLLIMAPNNKDGIISSDMLPPEIKFVSNEKNLDTINDFLSLNLKDAREKFEKEYLQAQIDRFGGNISRTSSFIRMERSALHRKLKNLLIEKK